MNLSQTDGGTDRTPAQRRALANDATTLTGIPLLDGPSLHPDTAGHLSTLPEKVSHATATTILSRCGLTGDVSTLLRKVNPATSHNGRRPRKSITTDDGNIRFLTIPQARTNHGSTLHAAFQAPDVDLRSFHGTARQTPLTPYQEARILVATRKAHRALARLATNQGADW